MVRSGFIASLLLCIALLGACGSTTRAPRESPKGLLLLHCDLPDAEIWLDSRYLREMAEIKGGIRLGPGLHRLEVRHAQHHTMYYEIELVQGERRLLEVELARRLP